MGTKKICHCGKRSLPGLVSGVALCQYHYDVRQFGKAWADKCRADDEREREFQESARAAILDAIDDPHQ